MKKVFQPNVRKVYGATPQESQINAVRKIHNLLSSGAVTVTGPTQPRILKQKFVGSTGGGGIVQHQQNITNIGNQQQQQQINMHHQSSIINSDLKCYVCDEPAGQNYTLLNEATTSNTQTKLPNKIGQIVGDAFMVIISCEDVLCKRCTTMINHYDRLETDIERVKTNILNYLYKKYGLSTDDDDRRTQSQYNNNSGNNITTATIMSSSSAVATTTLSPPIKMQKLNTTGNIVNRRIINNNNDDDNHTRKITIHNIQTNRDPIENQLSTLFESGNLDTKTTSHTSAVQQIKILSPQQQQQQQQPPKRGPIKIYKCMSCEFKTTDLKQFQPHYETCKQQNLQNNYCKICKKQFTNTMLFKQHMTEKHNQSEFSCPVCYIKFLNDITLKKHIEINHPDLKPINEPTASQLYACNMCHYMTSDKPNYDEHMRKHVKVKPFKCRLCSTRFETREQASIHAKSHQPNYYKCGTCSASFTQRELLVKHFETHQQNQQQQQQQQQQTVQQQKPQQQSLTTQKLLQETIDEALRESDHVETKGIHFFSCNICSLTFIQENYYNQHMETHKKDGSNNGGNVGVGKKTIAIVSTNNSSGGGGGVGQTSVGGSTVATVVSTAGAVITTSSSQSLIRQEIRNTNILTTAPSGVVNSGVTSHSSNSNSSTAAVTATISEADIESIFEKMHSDKSDNDGTTIVTTAGTTTTTGTSDSLVITSQENAVGGITFNITIPQQEHSQDKKTTNEQQDDGKSLTTNDNISVGISMPVLDQPEESSSQHSTGGEQNKNNISEPTDDGHHHQHHQHHQQNTITDHHQQDISQESTSNSSTVPVSMPSLDDDGEATGSNEHEQHNMQQQHHENENQHQQDQEQQHHDEQQQQQHHQVMNSDQVAMELEDMQNSVESGQIKFILNENGQILQLDNHIITTDADGNQILVEGTDSEQIQQLLQSVGVLQSGGGLVDGETLQMIQGENNQMIIVQQGEDGHQLIDASLLNADGHIVIQQSHHDDSVDMDGTTHHQAHAIDEDGVRIPVSVAYTADGQQIVQATTSEHQEQQHIQQQQQQQQHDDDHNMQNSDTNENIGSGGIDDSGNTTTTGSSTTTQSSLTQVAAGGGNGSEEFFALDDLKI